MNPNVESFFDPDTWTLTYVVWDAESKDAVVIDPVLDYEPASSTVSTKSLVPVIDFIEASRLTLHLILETHAHADHISGSQALKKRFPGAKIGIGANITAVQAIFSEIFNLGSSFATDGSQFDLLLADNSITAAGRIRFETLFTPGHTPACVSYVIGNTLFVGDAIFMPDYGTGRCDFPAGSAADLYDSIHRRLYAQPDEMRLFVGHDYQPNGRELRYEASIAEQKAHNIHLKANTTKEEFVACRSSRDKQLDVPRLLLPSVQVNIRAGIFPDAEANGVSYLKIPLN